MRFQSRKTVDPYSQEEFTRPVTLHRRDPRAPSKSLKEEDVTMTNPDGLDDKERERQEIVKLQREAQKAADLAQIAPTGTAVAKKAAFRNEKTTQVWRLDKTEAQKKDSDLRYEEALPWHLEDADGKNTWVGTYEAALSDTNAVFVIDGGAFKMIPLEKWYKLTAKASFKTLTTEEAEAAMNKKTKESRWAMHTQEQNKTEQSNQQALKKYQGRIFAVKTESGTFKSSTKGETRDVDSLDFDDHASDDEEHMTVDKAEDEETKDAEDRIKREQLGANLFGSGDEAEVEKELEDEEKEEEARRQLGKEVKKALRRREKNYIYESDNDLSTVCFPPHSVPALYNH